MSSRVQSVSRLLYKSGRGPKAVTDCRHAQIMVKRRSDNDLARTKVTVEAIDLKRAKGDTVKGNGAWRYPGGVIQRHAQRWINGKEYWDDKDPSENRRKHESNLFITLGTNRSMRGNRGKYIKRADRSPGDGPYANPVRVPPAQVILAKQACANALEELSKESMMCQYFKFGPKHAMYRDDRFNDVVQSVEWQPAVEIGELADRLHAHIWLTVNHYSQVQINMPVMQMLFKESYNRHCVGVGVPEQQIKSGLPYIDVKLLPTADWAMVLKQYMAKGMTVS